MNKEEQDIIVFLEISATTKIEKTILSKEDVKCLLNLIDKLQADKNKLINYIAIRENKTHEEVCKEFEV